MEEPILMREIMKHLLFILISILSFSTNAQENSNSIANETTPFSKDSKDRILVLLQHAQNYDSYIEVKSIFEVIEVRNMDNEMDTLVLYFTDTKFASDNWKRKRYLRLCFYSQPYQFYQVEVENKKSGFSLGQMDRELKTIEVLRNGVKLVSLSDIGYTIME